MLLLALLLQVQPATAASAAPPQRFSILVEPCAAATRDGKDVVVCGRDAANSPRLPDPDSVTPDHPVPFNPYKTGAGALAATGTPCAARMGGCQVGFGPPIVPMVMAAVNGLKNAAKDRRKAAARRRDGDRRVPIALEAEGAKGRLEP